LSSTKTCAPDGFEATCSEPVVVFAAVACFGSCFGSLVGGTVVFVAAVACAGSLVGGSVVFVAALACAGSLVGRSLKASDRAGRRSLNVTRCRRES
jgi:hypothetical protein